MKRSQIELWARLFLTCSLGHCYRGLVDIYYMIIVVNNLVFIYFGNNKRALGHDEVLPVQKNLAMKIQNHYNLGGVPIRIYPFTPELLQKP